MSHVLKQAAVLAAPLLLAACAGVGGHRAPPPAAVEQVSAEAGLAEVQRVRTLMAWPAWSFTGRVAISRGREGGSGRIEWHQVGRGYDVALSAPVTRQRWRLVDDGHQGEARLEGLPGDPRGGADAEALLAEATGWRVPVNFLPDGVLGLPACDAPLPEQVARDAQGRPRQLQQLGWDIQYLDWYPPEGERPALPRRIEAASGDAKVRLIVDEWTAGQP